MSLLVVHRLAEMTLDALGLVKVRDDHLRMGFLLERQQLEVDQ
ncbi:hypothetical protein A2U01_0078172, partial [Trifolium medium]|nr:hypothetical protein [Trifolium medium]